MKCSCCSHDLGPRIEVNMSLFSMHEWNLNIRGDLPASLFYELKKDKSLFYHDGMFTQGMGGAIEAYGLLKQGLEIIEKIRKATSEHSNQTKVIIIFTLDNIMTIKEEYPKDWTFSDENGDYGSPVDSPLSYWTLLKDYLEAQEVFTKAQKQNKKK